MDDTAAAALAGLLPEALHPLRGVRARPGWPLVVDPGAAAEGAFARALGPALAEFARAVDGRVLADLVPRLERRLGDAPRTGEPRLAAAALEAAGGELAGELELAAGEREGLAAALRSFASTLPPAARLLGFGATAVGQLAALAAERRGLAARAAAAGRGAELAHTAAGLLAADDERRSDADGGRRRLGRLGALGTRFLDAARLSSVLERRRAGEPLSPERRARLVAARDLLATVAEPSPPLWFTTPAFDAAALGVAALAAPDPCAAAAAAFDTAAAPVVARARAERLVRLEAAGELEPGLHLAALERLDWRDLTAAEMALVAPVFAVARGEDLLAGSLAALSQLLLSGRPVQVVVPVGPGVDTAPESTVGFEPGYLGLGHREVFVHQGSVARSELLAEGFARALAGARPALHVVDLPAGGDEGDLDAWFVAAARVSGRAVPLFRYEPEAGRTWARRLSFAGNPEPAVDWPRGGLEGWPSEASEPFTFVDAALLDPSWRCHFAAADGDGAGLMPVAEWLALPPEEAVRRRPAIVAVGADGERRRLVASRTLAFAARDRMGLWRTLEELAGVRSEHVDEAAERVRRELGERAARERDELEARHRAELERVRAEAAATAVARIVSGLVGGGPAAAAELAAVVAGPLAAPALAAPAAPTVAAPPAAAPAAAQQAPSSAAWLDSALCTSCDECVRKYPSIFVYNADKQATIKNPRGGTFRDLVRAAEACPARVIHPGEPWNPAEKDLAAWVERARKFD